MILIYCNCSRNTNTVLAAGVCSLKSNIPISHVESGLRVIVENAEEHNSHNESFI